MYETKFSQRTLINTHHNFLKPFTTFYSITIMGYQRKRWANSNNRLVHLTHRPRKMWYYTIGTICISRYIKRDDCVPGGTRTLLHGEIESKTLRLATNAAWIMAGKNFQHQRLLTPW